jgi:hypothetical protein
MVAEAHAGSAHSPATGRKRSRRSVWPTLPRWAGTPRRLLNPHSWLSRCANCDGALPKAGVRSPGAVVRARALGNRAPSRTRGDGIENRSGDALESHVGDVDFPQQHLVRVGHHRPGNVAAWPRRDDHPGRSLVALRVDDLDLPILLLPVDAGGDDGVAPRPQAHVRVDPLHKDEARPRQLARHLDVGRLALRVDLMLDDRILL